MNPGDYGCVQIIWLKVRVFGRYIPVPNLMGYLIRLFTASRYDHAFIYIGDGHVIESSKSGARVAKLSQYDGDKILWSTDKLTPFQRGKVVEGGLKLIGRPYGFLDILYLGLATMGLKFRWLLRRVENENRLICSQLVAVCGINAGFTAWLCGKENACLVTPGDLAKHTEGKK